MIVFYNPHVDDFLAEPVHFRLLRRRALKKYGFVFQEILKSGQNLNILVDASISGIIPERLFSLLPYFIRKPLAEIEYLIWKKINNLGSSARRVFYPKKSSNHILFAFSYKAATGNFESRRIIFSKYRAVVFHLSHYFIDSAEKSKNISSLSNSFLAGDSNILSIDYFKRWFGWYEKPFLILPFAIQDRFKITKPWSERENKAVATGSFHDLTLERPAKRYADYISTTGETTYHPIRKAIHSSPNNLEQWINIRVSPYRDYSAGRLKSVTRHFQIAQKGYFAINIVDLYNSFRFAVVGEELSGFPALGAFEAMACGCVLVAQPGYYEGLGLKPSVHYIEYSGDLQALVEKISGLQQQCLSEISSEGAIFIQREYSSAAVWKKWNTQLSIIK